MEECKKMILDNKKKVVNFKIIRETTKRFKVLKPIFEDDELIISDLAGLHLKD